MNTVTQQLAQTYLTSPLTLELAAFSGATSALERCAAEAGDDLVQNAPAAIERHARLSDAVGRNSRLWIALLADLVSPTIRLSGGLKNRLAQLGAAALDQGRRVQAGETGPKLLIDINRAVMAGLSESHRVSRRQPLAPTFQQPVGQPAGWGWQGNAIV